MLHTGIHLSTNLFVFSPIITNYIRRFSLLEGRKESQFFETALSKITHKHKKFHLVYTIF